jgi:tetratricopeptide (TPR) repeat protein
MLLDFHLAQEPLRPGEPAPVWLGGTPEYMAPEQRAGLQAVRDGRPVSVPVDGRADLWSLGLLLYGALGGKVPLGPGEPAALCRLNPAVSVGLSDIVARCLAREPAGRYPDPGSLALDLQRHLGNRPLRGVPNRSLAERLRKWRRRQPYAMTVTGLLAVLLAVAAAGGLGGLRYFAVRRQDAVAQLQAGGEQAANREYAAAVRTLTAGMALAERSWLPVNPDALQQAAARLRLARRAQAAQDLHLLVDQVRFLYGADSLPPDQTRELAARCQAVWEARDGVMGAGLAPLEPAAEDQVRTDLIDLGVLWADLRVRLARGAEVPEAQRQALRTLGEVERLCGPGPVLCREQERYARALGRADAERAAARRAEAFPPRTAWEHYAVGRSFLAAGDLPAAAAAFDRALDLQPQGFWPNFYHGVCAYRLHRYEEAVNTFRVCIALAPESAECYYNRGLAENALGRTREALRDYDRALQRNPALALAWFNRGLLYLAEKNFAQAVVDLCAARERGADPAAVYYNLALVSVGQHEPARALSYLQQALQIDPGHPQARSLQDRLQHRR